MQKGEGLSGYYRFMNKFGQYVWIQSRATMMFDQCSDILINFTIANDDEEMAIIIMIIIITTDTYIIK